MNPSLKVSNLARLQYKKLCKKSWAKCNGSELELDHKIVRSANLGASSARYGKVVSKRFFYLTFLIYKNEVKAIFLDRSIKPFLVSEMDKLMYDVQYKYEVTS